MEAWDAGNTARTMLELSVLNSVGRGSFIDYCKMNDIDISDLLTYYFVNK